MLLSIYFTLQAKSLLFSLHCCCCCCLNVAQNGWTMPHRKPQSNSAWYTANLIYFYLIRLNGSKNFFPPTLSTNFWRLKMSLVRYNHISYGHFSHVCDKANSHCGEGQKKKLTQLKDKSYSLNACGWTMTRERLFS